jgi:N-acyl-D-aspartate/D-glutamate deacylase
LKQNTANFNNHDGIKRPLKEGEILSFIVALEEEEDKSNKMTVLEFVKKAVELIDKKVKQRCSMRKKQIKGKKNGSVDVVMEEIQESSQNHNCQSEEDALPKNAKGK